MGEISVTARSLPTVLLVEDDPVLRGVVHDLLTGEGYAVVEAPDGGAAILALEEHRPPPDALCLVLLDMMLPSPTACRSCAHWLDGAATHRWWP
jgi:CheY-like chemotaxis protein